MGKLCVSSGVLSSNVGAKRYKSNIVKSSTGLPRGPVDAQPNTFKTIGKRFADIPATRQLSNLAMRWPGVPCHFAFCNLFWVSSWRALRVLGTGIEISWKIDDRGFSKNWFLEPNPVANDLMTPNEEMAGLRYFGVGTSNQREHDRNLTHFALPAPPPYWFIQNKRPNKARTSQEMLKPSRNNSKLRESNTNQKQARPKKTIQENHPKVSNTSPKHATTS